MARWAIGVTLLALGFVAHAAGQTPYPYGSPQMAPTGMPMYPTGAPMPMNANPMGPMGMPPGMAPYPMSMPMGPMPGMVPRPGMVPMPGAMPGPMQQPMFANDPMPMMSPQFCPPPSAPPADTSPFTLTNDGSPNAFSDEPDRVNKEEHGVLFYIGGMALIREKLGEAPLAFRSTGGVPGIDTGFVGIKGAPIALNFNDVRPDLYWGVRATLGFREGRRGFELTGFYLPEQSNSQGVTAAGMLDLPFGAFNAPLGFQGNNGLWLQADQVRLTVESTMYNAEGNFRFGPGPNFDWILGIRYLDVLERLNIFTDDDGILATPPNPALMANYNVRTHNRILGGQFGIEWAHPLVRRAAVAGILKGTWGVNFLDLDRGLQRGDGLVGFDSRQRVTYFSHLYEGGLFADILLTDQLRIRGGYQALWLVNVPESRSNVNFDLSNPTRRRDLHGSILYHGPMIELQFAF